MPIQSPSAIPTEPRPLPFLPPGGEGRTCGADSRCQLIATVVTVPSYAGDVAFHALHVEEIHVRESARLRLPFIPDAGAAVAVRTAVSDKDHQAAFDLLVGGYGRYQWMMPSAALVIRSGDMFQLDLRFRQGGVMVAEAQGRVRGRPSSTSIPTARTRPGRRSWAVCGRRAMAPTDGSYALGRALIDGCARAARANGAVALCLHLAEMSARGRDAARRWASCARRPWISPSTPSHPPTTAGRCAPTCSRWSDAVPPPRNSRRALMAALRRAEEESGCATSCSPPSATS